MNLRTLSHAIKIWVAPEIKRRVALGLLSESDLPVNLTAFQFMQWKSPVGLPEQEVQINDEVSRNILIKLRDGVSVEAGQQISLNQIVENEASIPFPSRNGQRAAFFRAERLYLQFLFMLDMTPNESEGPVATSDRGVDFDIKSYATEMNALSRMDPAKQMAKLSSSNWPPSAGCFPMITGALARDEIEPSSSKMFEYAKSTFTQEYFEKQLAEWTEYGVMGNRGKYYRHAIDRHFAGDYVSTVHVLAPLFEGLMRDLLLSNKIKPHSKQQRRIQQFKKVLYSRQVLTFPPSLIESILNFLEYGTIWKPSSAIKQPSSYINRHGIAHGMFIDFETEELSLKFLMLLDAFSFLLLHDRVASGALVEVNNGRILKGMLLSRVSH